MPIYAYKCSACGHTKDALQKMSDAPLTVCPACGQATFSKQVTAAGFQLKGGGWYVTDFKGGNQPASTAKTDADAKPAITPAAADAVSAKPETKSDSASPSPAVSAPTAAPVAAAPAVATKPSPAATT